MKSRFIIIMVIFIIAIGYYFFSLVDEQEIIDENPYTVEISRDEQDEEPNAPAEMNEDVVAKFPLNMREKDMQDALHWMSHSKVFAKEKWGHMEITAERIERLQEVVEANHYQYASLYKNMLSRWAEGDFSMAVQDHNSIWKIQGGTIGIATRLLNPEEEAKYRKKHFGQ
jgi:hypothetical protein